MCTELRDRSRETKVKTEKNTNTAFYNNLSNRKWHAFLNYHIFIILLCDNIYSLIYSMCDNNYIVISQ